MTLEQLLLPERSGRIDFLKEGTEAKSAHAERAEGMMF